MKIKQGLSLIFCLFWAMFAFAQEGAEAGDAAPIAMLKNASASMMDQLKANKTTLKSNPELMYQTVKRILVPHVDLDSMSRAVVGRTYWMQATPAQRDQFKELFTRQVVQTYSTALESYTNEKIKFEPIRGGVTSQRVQVQSVIIRSNGQNIAVNYRLVNNGNSNDPNAWKVYDFSVEGVSLIQSYNSQFANELSKGGLGGLIEKMQQRYGKQ